MHWLYKQIVAQVLTYDKVTWYKNISHRKWAQYIQGTFWTAITNQVMLFYSSNITFSSDYKDKMNVASHVNLTNHLMDLNKTIHDLTDPAYDESMDRVQLIADIGYLLSLLTLVFALLILTCIKRLRCPKNNLHLQLFISFIIRCVFHWVRRLGHEQLLEDPDVSSTH